MLKPKTMSRLLIVASKDRMEAVISELYRFNLFHIEEFVEGAREEYQGFKIGSPLPGAGEVSGELVKLRSIISGTSEELFSETQLKVRASDIRGTLSSRLPGIEHTIETLLTERTKLENLIKDYEQKIEALKPFVPIEIPLELLRDYENVSVIAGQLGREMVLTVPNESEFIKEKQGGFLVTAVPKSRAAEVERTLLDAAFQEVPVPVENGTAAIRTQYYETEKNKAAEHLETVKKDLDSAIKENANYLVACEELLTTDVEKAEAPLRFISSERMFIAEGWVPSQQTHDIISSLNRATAEHIYIQEIPVDLEHDSVPVEYNNPNFAKPTELFMDVYSRPNYTEIDPTLLVSIVFPIFFGMIIGDIAYGLIFLIMSLVLRKYLKGESGALLLKTLRNASISSIFFGILFSEFLGFECPWNPLIFSRHLGIGGGEGGGGNAFLWLLGTLIPQNVYTIHAATQSAASGGGANIQGLMVLTIWIGLFHITLGRVLGIINHAKQDHGSHRIKAVFANLGWLFVMWGILIAILSKFVIPYMPDISTLPVVAAGLNIATIIGGVLVVLGIIFIARDSVLEIIELPTIISHVLSYARLMAVGLSSVAIAMVTNYLAIGLMIAPQLKTITPFGILVIIGGIFVFLIGHVMNVALGLIGGGLHSIRLHYVEFFTKFYKGGGKKYNPFGMKRRFTED